MSADEEDIHDGEEEEEAEVTDLSNRYALCTLFVLWSRDILGRLQFAFTQLSFRTSFLLVMLPTMVFI